MKYRKLHLLPISVFVLIPTTFVITYTCAVLLGHVEPGFPYISDTGALPPESCVFAQLLGIASVLYTGLADRVGRGRKKVGWKIPAMCVAGEQEKVPATCVAGRQEDVSATWSRWDRRRSLKRVLQWENSEESSQWCGVKSELVTDSNENMISGAAQAIERVVGKVCASAEKRRKG
uniref:CWH43-like N-terminal domain-containing protein n=1 Tax=Timema bartmani TaxID=61472 RepID=A0A7R9EWI6_9NEOP|nr:unnamed protein product [Timema bartmani]